MVEGAAPQVPPRDPNEWGAVRASAEVVCRRVPRLVKHDVVRAWDFQHHGESEVLFLNAPRELSTAAFELRHRLSEVVAHQRDQVLPRIVVRHAFVRLMRGMRTYLARPASEDEPSGRLGLLDERPAEDVTKERPRGFWIVGIDEEMDGRDHLALDPKGQYRRGRRSR